MRQFNLKTLIQKGFWFINFSTMIKLTMHWLPRGKRPFFIFEGKTFTYRKVYAESVRYASFFLSQRAKMIHEGRLEKHGQMAIGIYQENTAEYLFTAFGAGLSNCVLFAINTGFKGKTLATVINQAGLSLLITNHNSAGEIEAILPDIKPLTTSDIFLSEINKDDEEKGFLNLKDALLKAKDSDQVCCRARMDNTRPVLVIYTSGTTGVPKGVPISHLKMVGAGFVVQSAVHLSHKDRGYICMPLFHSNAWYIGILPTLIAGSSFVLKRRFSASAFEEDILKHGVTFMNYVGQPFHYILFALEQKYGDGETVEKVLARHPKNRFRIAYGNGAPPVDRMKCMRYLGMDHIYEIYGSTEAVITSVNMPGDPIDSVGKVPDSVVILNENGQICPPGITDENGRLINYYEAVGEISKKVKNYNLRFDGYFDNADATQKKFSNGYYHSGDLGHIRLINGKRYLFFNGRTDDWIRKDGENFSAENVIEYALKIPGVKLAIAYGVPSEVSDEKVMVALQLLENVTFDPKQTFNWFLQQQKKGGMDPKWMPDYIRIVDAFPLTNTHKILVRPFKRDNFNIEKHPDMEIYFRQRGDNTFRKLTLEVFQAIKAEFVKNGRANLLEQ